ncbi:MAG: CPBP family intramembrane glutamic endopeptidase, partial [Candidatus Kariarchaeaceae archaeon]
METTTQTLDTPILGKPAVIILELLIILLFMVFITGMTPIMVIIFWGLLRWRGKSWADLGLQFTEWKKIVLPVTVITATYLLVNIFLLVPLLSTITGSQLDLSLFDDLTGNWLALLGAIAVSWILAGLGEEMVYRGYLMNRVVDLVGDNRAGWIIAIGFTAGLFGLGHLYQGIVGVISVIITAIIYSLIYLRWKRNLVAAIYA